MASTPESIILYAIIGFCAQIVDGAIGMAYGLISTSFLLSVGIPPAVASAAVHTSEIVTTGISGFSHAMFKNVDYALCRRLAIPGVIGAILGAYTITILPMNIAKPFIAIYLLVMGLVICYKAVQVQKYMDRIKDIFSTILLRRKLPSEHAIGLRTMGFGGGFFDAAGGGGWGPIVTSSLLAQGTTPHYTIGSVNLTEFLVAVSASATFFFTIQFTHWQIIVGLILGGSAGAPLAAYMVRRIPAKAIMLLVGIIIILMSFRTLLLMRG
jgi:hypothetical protein